MGLKLIRCKYTLRKTLVANLPYGIETLKYKNIGYGKGILAFFISYSLFASL